MNVKMHVKMDVKIGRFTHVAKSDGCEKRCDRGMTQQQVEMKFTEVGNDGMKFHTDEPLQDLLASILFFTTDFLAMRQFFC